MKLRIKNKSKLKPTTVGEEITFIKFSNFPTIIREEDGDVVIIWMEYYQVTQKAVEKPIYYIWHGDVYSSIIDKKLIWKTIKKELI